MARSGTACVALGVAAFIMATQSGCATFGTIDKASPGSPKVYSGTRLDVYAITDNGVALRRFPAAPPRYPLLDLPFCLVADTMLLPLTVPTASYEFLFEREVQ